MIRKRSPARTPVSWPSHSQPAQPLAGRQLAPSRTAVIQTASSRLFPFGDRPHRGERRARNPAGRLIAIAFDRDRPNLLADHQADFVVGKRFQRSWCQAAAGRQHAGQEQHERHLAAPAP